MFAAIDASYARLPGEGERDSVPSHSRGSIMAMLTALVLMVGGHMSFQAGSLAARKKQTFNGQHAMSLWSWNGVWGSMVNDTKSAMNETKSAVRQVQNSTYTQRAEQTGANASTATAHEVASVVHDLRHETKSAVKQVQNSSSVQDAEQTMADTASTATSAVASSIAAASRAMHAKVKALGAKIVNETYTISPLCLDAMAIGAVVIATGVAPTALLGAAGFTAEGVEAESLAAIWQSTIGDVEKGSLFARLQAAGATGEAASAALKVTGVTAVGALAFCDTIQTLRQAVVANHIAAERQ
mmetsp:Transcript_65102/g.128570  ORF Transcript_65102/g.128570 Transcript_65102/m.128570 type:complete len:299 (-) Transcript_65102:91-987(-)